MEIVITAYYSLVLVILGTLLNLFTFLILLRLGIKKRLVTSTFYYMCAIVIFDILMLYGWNLDHYLGPIQGFTVQRLSIPLCRIFSFLNYFAPQSSAWLRVIISGDRFFGLYYIQSRWFNHSKYVLRIIFTVILCFTLLNLQFLIIGCSYRDNGTISVYSNAFVVYPLWDYINLGVYNCLPFLFMILFNTGIIYYLIFNPQTVNLVNSRQLHRSISITLLITTFLFLFMTIPATVAFAFFSSADQDLLRFLDGLLNLYHILSFPLYFTTFSQFRRECFVVFGRRRSQRTIVPIQQISKI